MADLPAGMVYHCDKCGVVIPEDAPRPAGGDCEWVARHQMSWFDPDETVRGQHTMATAAWKLIYHALLHGADAPADALAYLHRFQTDPVQHFRASQAQQALTAEQRAAQRTMKPTRDAAFYKD